MEGKIKLTKFLCVNKLTLKKIHDIRRAEIYFIVQIIETGDNKLNPMVEIITKKPIKKVEENVPKTRDPVYKIGTWELDDTKNYDIEIKVMENDERAVRKILKINNFINILVSILQEYVDIESEECKNTIKEKIIDRFFNGGSEVGDVIENFVDLIAQDDKAFKKMVEELTSQFVKFANSIAGKIDPLFLNISRIISNGIAFFAKFNHDDYVGTAYIASTKPIGLPTAPIPILEDEKNVGTLEILLQ